MIASLPMYARASNRAAHEILWSLIRDGLRAQGIPAPDGLDHEIRHMDSWAHPDLVLGQICNLPLRTAFMDKVTVIGASDYGLDGCEPGYYRSAFIVRSDCPASDPLDMIDSRFVCNEQLSQSGYCSAQLWALTHGRQFQLSSATGSHRASIAAVAEGRGDIAAIDAQTWWIECRETRHTDALKVIGHTVSTPGMTFITRKGQYPQPYLDAIAVAIDQLPTEAAQILGLTAIVSLGADAYDLPFPPKPAAIAI
jgi:ABC-type phosphate/phosphonate transport system substrate-binding protein